MSKERIEEFEKLVENKTLTTELLIACMKKNETYISRFAYLKMKYKHAGEANNGGNIRWFNDHMSIRNNIHKILKHKYTKDQMKELGKARGTSLPVKLLNQVAILLDTNDYTLVD